MPSIHLSHCEMLHLPMETRQRILRQAADEADVEVVYGSTEYTKESQTAPENANDVNI